MEKSKLIWLILAKNTERIPADMHLDMHNAVYRASLNMALRHDIKLELQECFANMYIIRISGESCNLEKFMSNYGRRLRGISLYLLKHYPEKYRPLCSGKRLFVYREVQDEDKLQVS